MGRFRHGRRLGVYPGPERPHATGIDRFWAWWARSVDVVTAAVEDGETARVSPFLDRAVHAIDPGLTWHIGAGERARARLVVSGARHPALRVAAERWRRTGPPDGPLWEFRPAVPPEPGWFETPALVAGIPLDPARAAAAVHLDGARFRVDLTVHHPVFSLPDGDDPLTRSRIANLLVGWALGEDDADRWIGRMETTTTWPRDGVPVAMLGSLTGQVADLWGGERWARLEGTFGRDRLVATVRHPLHRVDHPLADEHLAVWLPYRTSRADGLPGPDAEYRLDAARSALMAELGDDAVLVATQTAGGERLLHVYADSWTCPAETARAVLTRGATVQSGYDPGWEAVEHLRTAAVED